MMNQHRIEQLMKSMEKEHLPQLLLCDPHTIAYLTVTSSIQVSAFWVFSCVTDSRPFCF